jgi:phage terminase large subunit-like protein
MPANALAKWKTDPVAFIREVLINPETGKPFELYPAQERFLREALKPIAGGRLPYPEAVFSAPKKSGKTATAAMAMLYVIVALGGPHAEGNCIANDYEQAQSRVFQAIGDNVKAAATWQWQDAKRAMDYWSSTLADQLAQAQQEQLEAGTLR